MRPILLVAYLLVLFKCVYAHPFIEAQSLKVSPEPSTENEVATGSAFEAILHLIFENLNLNDVPSILKTSKSWAKKVMDERTLKIMTANSNNFTVDRVWVKSLESGFLSMVQFLIKEERIPRNRLDRAMAIAIEHNQPKVLKYFMAVHAIPLPKDALARAAGNNAIEVVSFLLHEIHVDPSENKNAALNAAIEKNHFEMVQLLLSTGRVNPGAFTCDSIVFAAGRGYLDLVKFLLMDPRVNARNDILYNAAMNNHSDIVKEMLQDPHIGLNDKVHDALAVACQAGYIDIVKMLAVCGYVDISGNDNDALQLAALNGQTEVIKYLTSLPQFYFTEGLLLALGYSHQFGYEDIEKILSALIL